MRHATTTRGLAAAALAAAVTLSACSGGSSDDKSTSPPAPTSSGSSSSPAGTPSSGGGSPAPDAPQVNPLNGGQPSKNGVVAVKIDDTANGRPQRNIDDADVVYIEQVEGGLTRLLAVYNSSLPTVEAVRSTRANDPEELGSYGPIAYVASGGAYNPLKVLRNSRLKASINDAGGPGFQRDGSRGAPYNLTANLGYIAKKLKAPRAQYVGFNWSYSKDQLQGRPGGLHVRTTVGSTPIAFDFDSKTQRYVRSIGGVQQHQANGASITASNVLVQFCKITPYYKDIDVNGNPSMYTHSVGSGKLVLFRNGKRINGHWQRKHYTGATSFTDATGKQLLFRPGNVWVVLVASTASVAGS